jgi:hypothetical protein
MVAYVVGGVYSFLFGWYDKRLARRELARLEREIREQLSFLFSSYNGQIMPIKKISRLKDIDWPTVEVSLPGLLLKFVRWRGELQAYVTPEQTPNDWVELSLLLNLIDVPEKIDRRSDYKMSEVAGWLRSNLERINTVYSDHGIALKEQLAHVYDRDRVIAKQWETEINRRLYPDK